MFIIKFKKAIDLKLIRKMKLLIKIVYLFVVTLFSLLRFYGCFKCHLFCVGKSI